MANFHCKIPANVPFSNENIQSSIRTKFLGTLLASNLNWNNHIESVGTNLNKAYCAMKQIESKYQGLLYMCFDMTFSCISRGIERNNL